jgi:hypothetical protein
MNQGLKREARKGPRIDSKQLGAVAGQEITCEKDKVDKRRKAVVDLHKIREMRWTMAQ